jgi:hypothetical protein
LAERLETMLSAFGSEFGVTKGMIESLVGHGVKAMSEDDLVTLRGIYKAVKDGQAKREDYFDLSEGRPVGPGDARDAAGQPAPEPDGAEPPDAPDGGNAKLEDL